MEFLLYWEWHTDKYIFGEEYNILRLRLVSTLCTIEDILKFVRSKSKNVSNWSDNRSLVKVAVNVYGAWDKLAVCNCCCIITLQTKLMYRNQLPKLSLLCYIDNLGNLPDEKSQVRVSAITLSESLLINSARASTGLLLSIIIMGLTSQHCGVSIEVILFFSFCVLLEMNSWKTLVRSNICVFLA